MLLLILIFLGKLLLGILLIALGYVALALILSLIPWHRKYQHSEGGIDIYLISNGVHTDFVMPADELSSSWWDMINVDDFGFPKEELRYIGFGWGDKGFYLDTPTWAELKFSTAVNAMLIPSPTLMHIKTFDSIPSDHKYFQRLRVTPYQFSKLCWYIYNSFQKDKNQNITLLPNKGYTPHDNFYLANGKYHAFNTCNYWVNRGLRKIGVRTSLWTPMDRGIFYQLNKLTPVI